MKAAVIQQRDRKVLVYEDAPKPVPGEGEALVRVRAVGICGSDVHGFFDQESVARVPGLIMGHEAAGEVVEVSVGVSGLRVGDRVAVDPQVVCGSCESCRRAWPTVCSNKRIIGSALRGFLHGAMADYVAVPASQLYRLPAEVSFEAGALVEPFSNALHVLNRVHLDLGDTVVVLGTGTLGLCLVQAAKLAGAGRVVATDVSPFRLRKALEVGADVVWHGGPDATARLLELTDGRGADVVIEAVGIESTYRQAIDMVRRRGSIMFFGAITQCVKQLLPILHKELTLIGCTGAAQESATAVELMASGRVATDALVTHRFPLSEAQTAFDLLAEPGSEAIKVMLIP
jgi:2-desacetyl-2-hydroxyethyl bacteriochlorophyllide A dehydrogenase